jgi:hypothetical protein
LLKGGGGGKDQGFRVRRADDLHPDRQAISGQPAWYHRGRDSEHADGPAGGEYLPVRDRRFVDDEFVLTRRKRR